MGDSASFGVRPGLLASLGSFDSEEERAPDNPPAFQSRSGDGVDALLVSVAHTPALRSAGGTVSAGAADASAIVKTAASVIVAMVLRIMRAPSQWWCSLCIKGETRGRRLSYRFGEGISNNVSSTRDVASVRVLYGA